jgi:hypothetical protein
MKLFLHFFIFAAIFLASATTFAKPESIVHFTYGIKSNTWKMLEPEEADEETAMSGSSLGIDAYLSPRGLPIGFGFFYNSDRSTGKEDEVEMTFSEQVGGLQLMLWVPWQKFRPFVKFGYVLFGESATELKYLEPDESAQFVVESVTYKSGKVNGFRGAGGFSWQLAKNFSVLGQFTYISETTEYEKATLKIRGLGDIDGEASEKLKIDTSGMSYGLGIGLNF